MSAVVETSPLMSFIERASRDDSFDLDKFQQLLMLQREQEERAQRHEFNRAMADVQAELQPIIRDRLNTHTRSKYATHAQIDAVARPVYTKHGFSVRFGTTTAPRADWVRVTCEIAHSGGYSEQHYLDGPLDSAGSAGTRNKTGIQAVGSTITYLRRYLMMLILNLVAVDDEADDDGEATRQQPDRREQINRETPLNGEPKRDTRDVYLDWLDDAVKKAPSLDAVNQLLAHENFQRALREFTGARQARLTAIRANGLAAHAPVKHEEAEQWPSSETAKEQEQTA